MAKCPSCSAVITYVSYNGVEARQSFGSNKLASVAYCCPACDAVLSVQADPVAIKTDTVKALLKALKI